MNDVTQETPVLTPVVIDPIVVQTPAPLPPKPNGFNLSVPVEELRKKKLFIATPMYGGQCTGMFSRSVADLAAMCNGYQIPLQLYFLFNESLITRARNYCCDEFMRSGATHLMFIDSDIGFDPRDVIALLALSSEDSEYDVIGGPYPKKCISWEKVKTAVDKGFADEDPNHLEKYVGDYVFNPKGGQTQMMINAPAEVLEIGTGFMMIRRRTLEKFQESFPHLMYRPDHVRTEHFDGTREIMMYFQAEIDTTDYRTIFVQMKEELKNATDLTRIQEIIERATALESDKKSKRYLSEDYWFCQKLQELELKTWLCPWMRLQHVGSYVFGGSLADIAAVGASATADSTVLEKGKHRAPEPQKLQKKRG